MRLYLTADGQGRHHPYTLSFSFPSSISHFSLLPYSPIRESSTLLLHLNYDTARIKGIVHPKMKFCHLLIVLSSKKDRKVLLKYLTLLPLIFSNLKSRLKFKPLFTSYFDLCYIVPLPNL